jgi:large repetitive protein
MLRAAAIALILLGVTSAAASADAGPPNVTGLKATPLGRVERTVSFEWSSDQAGVAYTCSIDKAAPAPCVSPLNYEGDEGEHTLEVRATNADGVTGAPAKTTVRIVETHILGGPAQSSFTNATSASFSFEGGLSYACAIDSAPEAPCPSKLNLTGLADGRHVLFVRAHYDDVAYDRIAEVRTWDVDTIAPETTLTGDSAPFSFTAGEPATFLCSVDGEPWGSCASPRAVTGLAGGFHAFEVKAIDRAGNQDAAPAQRVWFVRDAVLPAPQPDPQTDDDPGLAFRYRNGRFVRLALTGIPAGRRTVVTVTCPRRAPSCPDDFTVVGSSPLRPLIGVRLAPGTRIVVAGMKMIIRRGGVTVR